MGIWGWGSGTELLATGDCGCTVAEATQKHSPEPNRTNRSLVAKS
jgi:hypothetical protein